MQTIDLKLLFIQIVLIKLEKLMSIQLHMPKIRNMGGYQDFNSPLFYVWDEINDQLDCSTCDYRATSILFENKSLDQGFMIACELYSLLKGCCQLYYSELFKHLSRDTINLINNNFDESKYVWDIQAPNYFLYDIFETINKDALPFNFTQPFDILLYLSIDNVDIYILLKLLSEPTSWYSLYKIYETLETYMIEMDYPNIYKTTTRKGDFKKLDNPDILEKFTKPANNFSIVGLDARHGVQPTKKPINVKDCFSLPESGFFLHQHVKNYFQWRVNTLLKKTT